LRTITIAAYRRPVYLQQVLDSLSEALKNCPEFRPDSIILGIDPGGHSEIIKMDWPPLFEIIQWPEHLGINEHPRRLLQYAFMELGSDFNVHLEDDTVLSPDALRLALWFQRTPNDALTLSLHNPSYDYEHPERVYRTERFGCWGWACNRPAWMRWLSHYWNYKRELPIGWDWSISKLMAEKGMHSFAPSLSRVHNIGREGGQYQTPEGYDRDFAGQVWAGMEHMQRTDDFKL
jgi:hypothetical protein